MFNAYDVKKWLRINYPELSFQTLAEGAYGIYQENYQWIGYDYKGFEFYNLDVGYSNIFITRNRLIGSWIKDEVQSRDPHLKHNEGNVYYQAYKMSLEASKDKDKRDNFAKSSGETSWDIVKRNPALMERIGKKLKKGDAEGAAKEVSVLEIAKNAAIENPSEMRNQSFINSVTKLER